MESRFDPLIKYDDQNVDKASSCSNSETLDCMTSSTSESKPSCEEMYPVEPPTGSPCESTDTRRSKPLEKNPKLQKYGPILFRARMVYEGKYEEYRKVWEEVRAGSLIGGQAELAAIVRMGYISYEDEYERYAGRIASAVVTEIVPPTQMERVRFAEEMSNDWLMALREAGSKVDEEGLRREAFRVPGAWSLYQYYWNPDTRKNFWALIEKCIISPKVKAGTSEDGQPLDEKTKLDRAEMQQMIREATQ